MDLGSLGVDIGAIVAIGAIAEWIKKLDPQNKFKRLYVLIPVVLSVLVAVGVGLANNDFSNILLNIIKYFGVSSFGYSFIKKTLLQK